MVKLTEGQEEAIASIALASKQFTTCAASLMHKTGLDKVKGFQLLIYINPEFESSDGDIIIGHVADGDNEDGLGCGGFAKEVGKSEYRTYGYTTKGLKRIFEDYHV